MRTPTLDDARAVLSDRFGYPDFRPGQTDVVAAVLSGRDTLAVLPTGGGKSLCYQVPALVRDGLTVVVSPLVSLMKDQVDRLVARGVDATFLNSTLDDAEEARRLALLDGDSLKLLYVAPERLGGNIVGRLRRRPIAFIAVDEAHCISEWGHEFRPSFRRLAEVRKALGKPQVVALTATATPDVRNDIARQLALVAPAVIIGGFDRANLDYSVHACETVEAKEEALVRLVRSHQRPAIVYAPTRLAVERVAKRLTRAGIRALPYHGGLSDYSRAETQDRFMRADVDTIVATNAFGMGIDKPDVRLVAHWAMPGTLEAYYQEAGRAGRDGLPSKCVLLFHASDRLTHEWFIRGTFPSRDAIQKVATALEALREGGSVTASASTIAANCRGVAAREARAVLALLGREGILLPPSDSGLVWLRLLATPARIRRELGADAVEIGLLRALWQQGSQRLQQGTVIHLDDFELSRRRVRRLLTSLRDRQFVDFSIEDQDLRVHEEANLAHLRLDWTRLARRRESELRRLDMMEGYAVTSQCRRAYVLGYFGERLGNDACSGCDNCRGRDASVMKA